MIFSPNIKLTPIPANIFGKENIKKINIGNIKEVPTTLLASIGSDLNNLFVIAPLLVFFAIIKLTLIIEANKVK